MRGRNQTEDKKTRNGEMKEDTLIWKHSQHQSILQNSSKGYTLAVTF